MGKHFKAVIDKAISHCVVKDENMIALPEFSGTWTLISKNSLKYIKKDGKIYIDFDEAVKKGVDPNYLKKLSGFKKMYGRGDF